MLQVQDLSISFGANEVVSGLDISLNPGEILGVVGESGSGKSVTMLSLFGLLPSAQKVAKRATYSIDQHTYDLTKSETGGQILGGHVGYIFQEPMSALHPLISCGNQIAETIRTHQRTLSSQEVKRACLDLLTEMEIPNPEESYKKYPHEFSGGQRQRIMIALAMANNPDLVIADEPTTALDGILQKKITELLVNQCRTKNTSLILISHDINLVKKYTDNILVLYKGKSMEYGPSYDVTNFPKSLYTKSLLECQPNINKKGTYLPTIDLLAEFDGKEFHARKEHTVDVIPEENREKKTALSISNLSKSFGKSQVLKGISLDIMKGEVLGLLGPSGCGKSTLCKIIMGLEKPSSGTFEFHENGSKYGIQMIFQDPYSSLNPNLSIGNCLEEVLKVRQKELTKADRISKSKELIQEVGLSITDLQKFPHEFSGGQRQRISIARALAAKPHILLCDESVSALDISIQAQVLNLFSKLKQDHALTYVFISHDLNVLNYMCDRIAVMDHGRILEIKTPLELRKSSTKWVQNLNSHIGI